MVYRPAGTSWAKWLGNGAGGAAFILILGLSLVHDGFNTWTQAMDAELLGLSHSRYHPTLVISAAAVALAVAAIGYLVGTAIDKRQSQ